MRMGSAPARLLKQNTPLAHVLQVYKDLIEGLRSE